MMETKTFKQGDVYCGREGDKFTWEGELFIREGEGMSVITICPKCGKPIVLPAYEGDGAYPLPDGCNCDGRSGGVKP